MSSPHRPVHLESSGHPTRLANGGVYVNGYSETVSPIRMDPLAWGGRTGQSHTPPTLTSTFTSPDACSSMIQNASLAATLFRPPHWPGRKIRKVPFPVWPHRRKEFASRIDFHASPNVIFDLVWGEYMRPAILLQNPPLLSCR